MSLPDVTWALGRPTIGGAASLASRLRVYGRDRVPLDGGVVVASNHFSWLDPAVLGASSPRVLYYMAKVQAHRVPGLGALIPTFGNPTIATVPALLTGSGASSVMDVCPAGRRRAGGRAGGRRRASRRGA